ncbi:tyrosine-type recombinase/integrase [Methanococcus maripaludis]|uniref:Putative phage integrase n=1 Tax=Methanococcus maripaludis OS7 TaxID=637915 RepID=A0A2Z5PET3_METMI|nr:tyrosine-type recombinase/integrase [Methanococcus maripaludis]BAP62112.1 putative phage integrase [Methanococcus maripaludis OS7]
MRVNKEENLNPGSKEVFQKFMNYNSHHSESYTKTLRYSILNFMEFVKKDSFFDVDVSDLIDFYNNKKCSKNTKLTYLTCLNVFYTYCIDNNYISNNPVLKYRKSLKKSKKERVYLTEKQQEMVYSRLADIEYRILYVFLVQTGLRRSELINLKFIDVELDDRIIHVHGGKGDKYRFVPISDELYISLKRWNYERALRYPLDDTYFITRRGKRYNERTLDSFIHYIDRAVPNLNVRVTPHILRHTFATNCINKKMDLKTLSLIMGHEDIGTTSIYLHKNKEQIKKDFLEALR